MPPAKKIDYCTIIADLKMDRQEMVNLLAKIVIHYFFMKPHSQISIILLSSRSPVKELKCKDLKILDINETNLVTVLNFIRGAVASDDKASLFDAFAVANEIMAAKNKNIITKRLVLLTDFISLHIGNDNKELINELHENEVYFYVFGPEVEYPIQIKNKDDVVEAMVGVKAKNVNLRKNSTFQKVLKIMLHLEGVICNAHLALDFFEFYANETSKQPFLEPLAIGEFKFETITTRISDELPKYFSTIRQTKKSDYFVAPTSNAEEPKQIEYQDVVKVHHILGKNIMIPEDVNQGFLKDFQRSFKILGFVDKDAFTELHLPREEMFQVEVDEKSPTAKAFYHLVASTQKKKKYVLVSRVYRAKCYPKIYILFPRPPTEFLMIEHPQAAIQCDYTENVKAAPNVDYDHTVYDYLKGINEYSTLYPLHPYLQVGEMHKSVIKKIAKHLRIPVQYKQDVDNTQLTPEMMKVVKCLKKEKEESLKADTTAAKQDIVDDDW